MSGLKMCAWCEVVPVKRAYNAYCDRSCAMQAVRARMPVEQFQANAAKLNRHQKDRYATRVASELERIWAEVAGDRDMITKAEMLEIAKRQRAQGYKNGFASAYMAKRRARLRQEAA